MANEFQLTPKRRLVLEVLRDHGEIEDKSGLAVNQLMKHTGHRTTNALSGVLQDLEQAELIERDTAGRRTYSIKITPAGKDALLATKPQAKRKRAPADATETGEKRRRQVARPLPVTVELGTVRRRASSSA